MDTHAHLDFDQYDGDRQAVLRRAVEAGVEWLVDVGADVPGSQRAVALAAAETRVWAAVGVHPHHAVLLTPGARAELKALATRPRVVAIGETGLDYFRDLSPRPQQRSAFEAQLSLALELGLPVIVHDRDAHDDVLAILRAAAGAGLRGVMHCFSGDPELAREVVGLGMYVGIAGPVTYPGARALAEVARRVPLERLLVETDCPYLAPQAHRGQRNEPAYVRAVVERVAELRGLSPDEVGRVTSLNARTLFHPRRSGVERLPASAGCD
ncbi:MAG: TatD family hydrolase [Anaerolineae bacterium]|nr:TatD family hydrolase [Anaerolineae bacterium]